MALHGACRYSPGFFLAMRMSQIIQPLMAWGQAGVAARHGDSRAPDAAHGLQQHAPPAALPGGSQHGAVWGHRRGCGGALGEHPLVLMASSMPGGLLALHPHCCSLSTIDGAPAFSRYECPCCVAFLACPMGRCRSQSGKRRHLLSQGSHLAFRGTASGWRSHRISSQCTMPL